MVRTTLKNKEKENLAYLPIWQKFQHHEMIKSGHCCIKLTLSIATNALVRATRFLENKIFYNLNVKQTWIFIL